MLSVVLRLCGQASGSPSSDLDQSYSRVSRPISPPPSKKAGFNVKFEVISGIAGIQQIYPIYENYRIILVSQLKALAQKQRTKSLRLLNTLFHNFDRGGSVPFASQI
jgi:hypothetical protein